MALEHELGAHSYSHASMGFESNAYLENDLRRCKDYFEAVVGTPMRIYAFPNGSYREEQIGIVAGSGVQHILLVGEDFASPDSPHTRFTFHAHSSSEVKFRALGGLRPVRTPLSSGSGSRLAPSQTVLKSLRIS